MFTPKQSNPIMLEDETVHTGTQKSRVHCSLPWEKSLLLWAFGQREVECALSAVTPHCPSHLTDGARPRRSATAASVAAVVTGPFPLLPGSPPAVDGSGQPCATSGWVRGVRWKQKGDVQMISPGERSVCLDRRL